MATAAVSFVKITNDSDSGISSANSYTHAIDFGVNNADTTINGVTFNKYTTGANGTLNFSAAYSAGSALDMFQNNNHGVTGQLANLMQDMIFNNGNTVDSTATWTLSGLTAGMTYETRIYTRTWASSAAERDATIVFDHDGAGAVSVSAGRINQDNATESPVGLGNFNDAYYISYTYTALADEDLVITAT